MSDLADAIKERDAFSKQLSDGVRQLSLAGIAIIWILRSEPEKAHLSFEAALYRPLIVFVISLTLDLCQYLWSSAVWDIVVVKARGRENSDAAIVQHGWWTTPTRVFFYSKSAAVIYGFYLLFQFVVGHLK